MAYYNATGKEREEDFLSSFGLQTGRAQGKNLSNKLGSSIGTQSSGADRSDSFKPSKPTKPSKPKKTGMSRNERNLRRRQGRL